MTDRSKSTIKDNGTGQTQADAEATQQAAKTAENNAAAADVVKDNPDVFGKAEGEAGDRKTPLERQTGFAQMTADQRHAVENGGKPMNEPAKTEGEQIELGDRVMLVTATPIGGQTVNPAHVIGFNSDTGLPNLRLELIDGGAQRPQEFGGVPQNEAREERGPYWKWPADFAAKDKGK